MSLDGEWQFDCPGCRLIQTGNVVISFNQASGESNDGKYYWSGTLQIVGDQVQPSELLVQDPGRQHTYCKLLVSGSFTSSSANLTATHPDGKSFPITLLDPTLNRRT